MRELSHRVTDGLEVQLFWDSESNKVKLAVEDHKHHTGAITTVPGDRALDAFYHPMMYVEPR